jgi:hypothetical protein
MGALLTKLTAWLAVIAYGIGVMMISNGRGRAAWTLGCALFLAHIACAFAFQHHWSHAAAYADTARQTAETTGLRWGGGLFFNYVFALAWLADVLWWWCSPSSRARSPRWLTISFHGFLFFMIFNGAVVFASGPLRWFGLLLCIIVAEHLWRVARKAPRP